MHAPRHFEFRQQPPAVRDQLLFRYWPRKDDGGGDLFAPGGVGYAETDRFLHRGVRLERLVDLPWGDFLSASVDEFFEATQQPQVVTTVECAEVTGSKPAIGERCLVGF